MNTHRMARIGDKINWRGFTATVTDIGWNTLFCVYDNGEALYLLRDMEYQLEDQNVLVR